MKENSGSWGEIMSSGEGDRFPSLEVVASWAIIAGSVDWPNVRRLVLAKLDLRSCDNTLSGEDAMEARPDGDRGRFGRRVSCEAAFFKLKRSA
jgi:hypothetical protein